MNDTTLNLIIDSADFKIGKDSERYIQERIEKVDTLTQRFSARQIHISLQVAERDRMHRFVISLSLPQMTISAHAEEPHLRGSFDRALKRLIRQLKEYKELLRREHLHNRVRTDKNASVPLSDSDVEMGVVDRDLEKFREGLGRHVENLEALIGSEILELKRRHPNLEVDAKEILERTLTNAVDFFNHKPRHLSRRSWLFRSAMNVLDEVVPRHTGLSKENNALASHVALDGWEVVIDHTDEAIATEAASMLGTEQLKPIVEDKLSQLPRDWRRAFRMHYVEGLSSEEIGELLDLDEQQVMFRLRCASEFLRDHIEEIRGQV